MESWIAAALAQDLNRFPLRVAFEGRDLVLFRDRKGRAKALEDRCPHRGMPLSLGRITKGRIACCYHGWEFDGDGFCQAIPSNADGTLPKLMVQAFETREVDGQIWIRTAP